MSEEKKDKAQSRSKPQVYSAREAITYYNPEEREADRAPLQGKLIKRIFGYTKPYAARRNWLVILTLCAACNCRRWPI